MEEELPTFIVDADDFCESNSDWRTLRAIKEANPDFKITLFTIPGLCSEQFIKEMKQFDWIKMVPHGWLHPHPREQQDITYEEALEYLDKIEKYGLEKGYKAPGWQISDGMYKALKERGYWVADQHYNDQRRPAGMRVEYPGDHHYHIGHLGGYNANAIEFFVEPLKRLRGNFILM